MSIPGSLPLRWQDWTKIKGIQMETFVEPKPFVNNPDYQRQRQAYLSTFSIDVIDKPIVDIISGFAKLPYCFTLQSCYGHFVYAEKGKHNIDRLPITNGIGEVEYRIAYIALCIENSDLGRALHQELSDIPEIDPDYIQFGSAGWFWKGHVNTYALQVEPVRHKTKDSAIVDYREALHIEKVRGKYFDEIRDILEGRGVA